MRFARSSVPGRLPGHGMPRVRDWPVWSLPPRVRAKCIEPLPLTPLDAEHAG
jgi:hypothetical protein